MKAVKKNKTAVMRDTFEWVRDRFAADRQRVVLFTTFNFVPRFFETNILPLLVGDTVDDLAGVSETRYAINDELNNVRCLVVCDRSTRPEPKGDMRYGLLPVGLPNGRFHPKLMLMAGTLKETGKPGLWLSVGSGNLSLSGWALNREIVSATPVAPQHASELLPLLRWILAQAEHQFSEAGEVSEEGGVRAILTELLACLQDEGQLQPAYTGMPTLHLAMPMEPRPGLLSALTSGRQWRQATVVSPYWSDVDTLVRLLGVAQCQFVPSLTNTGRYAFPLSGAASRQACSYTFGKFGDDQYTHAKTLLLHDADGQAVLCTGSANFTSAALRDPAVIEIANVEAVLRYELADGTKPWKEFADLDPAELDDSADTSEEDHAQPLPPLDASVYYDWAARAFGGQVTVTASDPINDIVLEVAGTTHGFLSQVGTRQQLPAVPFKCTQPLRSFSVSWRSTDGTRASYRGLVMQVNAMDEQLLYQPRPRLDKVLEFLRSLNPAITEDELRKRAARGRGEGSDDGEDDQGELTFDYFGLFQGTWKLRDYYRRKDAAGAARCPFDSTAPQSVTTLYRAVTLQPALTTEAQIGRYIQLAEVRELLAAFGREGKHPPPGSPCHDIEDEMDRLKDTVRTSLGESASFKAMFGTSTQDQVQNFLDWFHREMKQEGAAHAA